MAAAHEVVSTTARITYTVSGTKQPPSPWTMRVQLILPNQLTWIAGDHCYFDPRDRAVDCFFTDSDTPQFSAEANLLTLGPITTTAEFISAGVLYGRTPPASTTCTVLTGLIIVC